MGIQLITQGAESRVANLRLGAKPCLASLCLGTVDGLTQEKIAAAELETREREMFEIALDALVASLPRAAPEEPP